MTSPILSQLPPYTGPDGYEPLGPDHAAGYLGPVLYRRLSNDPESGLAAHFVLQTGPAHMNAAGQVQDGVLMGFADVVLAASVARAVEAPVMAISLNCDFTGTAAGAVRLEGCAEITRRTRSIVFVAGTVFMRTDSEIRTLMTGTGLWKRAGS